MTKLTLRPCVLQDLMEVRAEASDTDPHEVIRSIARLPNAARTLWENCRTLFVSRGTSELPIASFGVWPLWDGVGRSWSILSQEALVTHRFSLHKAVIRSLSALEARGDLRRVEAVVRFGHAEGRRWMEHLGFEHEGLMRSYGPGGRGDFHLYARLFHG